MEIFSHLLPKNSAIKLIGVLSYKYLLITVGAKRATGSDEQLVSPRKTNAQKTLTILDPYKIFQIYPKRCQARSVRSKMVPSPRGRGQRAPLRDRRGGPASSVRARRAGITKGIYQLGL